MDMDSAFKALGAFLRDDDGATAVEYALIISATAIALIAAMPSIRSGLLGIFNSLISRWI